MALTTYHRKCVYWLSGLSFLCCFGISLWFSSLPQLNSSIFTMPDYKNYLKSKACNHCQQVSLHKTAGVFTFNEYVARGSMGDAMVADPSASIVTISNSKKVFEIGERLLVRIDLYDTHRRHLATGGDMLRIWLVEGTSNVNGEIVDHANGTYTGSVLLPWRGNPLLVVCIANVKEHIGRVLKTIERYGLLYPIYAKYFVKPNKFSVNTCSPKPLKHWTKVCNLTSQNSWVEWYCEHPSTYNLTCKDWKLTNMSHRTFLTESDVQFIRSHMQMKIKQRVRIRVVGDTPVMKQSDFSCSKMDRNLTWINISPSGFYFKKNWRTIGCRSTLNRTKQSYLNCLKGRHILFIGDSNCRSFTSYLNSLLKLREKTRRLQNKAWQQYFYSERTDWDISMSWCAHETPFFSWPFFDNNLIKPPSYYLDNIGKNNNSVILIHMFFHFGRTYPYVFRTRVRQLRTSVENLLNRAPGVDIFIKGPHASKYFKMLDSVDYTYMIQQKIWRKEFEGLHDRVVYLEEWDITSATESRNIHPNTNIVHDMVHTFLSYLC